MAVWMLRQQRLIFIYKPAFVQFQTGLAMCHSFDMWIHSTQSGTAGGSLPHNAAVNMSFRIPILLHLSNS